MANQSRRDFLKTAALAGAAVTGLSSKVKAGPKNILSENRMGALIDTTVCIGCRKCEWACKTAHAMETQSIETYDDRSVFKNRRRPTDKALTVVNEYPNDKSENFPIDDHKATHTVIDKSISPYFLYRIAIVSNF